MNLIAIPIRNTHTDIDMVKQPKRKRRGDPELIKYKAWYE